MSIDAVFTQFFADIHDLALGARQLVPNTDESLYIKADAIDILPKE